MSENQNRGNIDFAQYDSMATEELKEILRLDAEMPQGQESDTDNTVIPMKSKRRLPRWVHGLTATAAVLAILVVGSVTAKAFGFDIWKAVVQWTQETFHFGNWGDSDPNNNRSYSSLQEAIEQGNVPAWLVPTHIPDEFNLTDVKAEQTPAKKRYTAVYTKGKELIRIIVQDHLGGDAFFVEQSDGLVEEYTVSGITYYLFENNNRTQAVWIIDSYECRITGELTIDILKEMINSIEKG